MILTAHQPTYLPWTGLFHKIDQADVFVFFDAVQFEYHEFGNRNRIMTPNGELMITIPVEKQGHMSKVWTDIKIADPRWVEKHVRTLQMAYSKAPFYDRYMPELEAIMRAATTSLADLNVNLIRWMIDMLGLHVETYRASEMQFEGKGSDLVLDMCMKLGAGEYIFGSMGMDYADVAAFNRQGIAVSFQDFTPPKYTRKPYRPHIAGLSTIDLLFQHGPASLDIINDAAARS